MVGRRPKLTAEQAKEVRAWWDRHKILPTVTAVARYYGVDVKTVRAIISHKTKHYDR
jgi:hypothetical protein